MNETMGALELGKSEVLAREPQVPRLGRVGRGYHLAMPLLKDTDMSLGVYGEGPDNHPPVPPNNTQKRHKEASALPL